jgi:hypothetical protein
MLIRIGVLGLSTYILFLTQLITTILRSDLTDNRLLCITFSYLLADFYGTTPIYGVAVTSVLPAIVFGFLATEVQDYVYTEKDVSFD